MKRVRGAEPLGKRAATCGGGLGVWGMSWASGSHSEAFLPVSQTSSSSDVTATNRQADPFSSLGLENRVAQAQARG